MSWSTPLGAPAGMTLALVGLLLLAPTGAGPRAPAVATTGGPSGVVPFVVHPGSVPSAGPTCSNAGLCPFAVRTAYNFTAVVRNGSTNGTGQSIVIVDACGDRHLAADVATFNAQFKLPATRLTITSYGSGTTCTNGIWSEETALDVEWAHVAAPGASIQLIVTTSANTSTIYGAWNYSINHGLGAQISNSWGGPGGCGPLISGYLTRAAAAGVTVLASSGDSGAWGSGTTQKPQNPADCAPVVAVGGTTLTLGTKGAYGSESVWSASGGGFVGGRAEPKYQRTANFSDPHALLAKADVAAVADPLTGVWIYNSARGGWFVIGGTSVACPLWAGLVADANALRVVNGFSTLGTLDPYLYAHLYGASGAGSAYPIDFHDVTAGTNGYSARTGWDPGTGLGSFNAGPLVAQLGNDPAA